MPYPSLGDWNTKQPQNAEDAAVALAEALAWTAIDQLTAGRVAFTPVTVRPIVAEADGSVRLDGPVGGIQRIRIDGQAFTGYRLEGNYISRLDGNAWDLNEDMTLAATAVGVFEVTYFQGWRPGIQLIWAAAELAAEFYKAAAGDKQCRLPKGVRSIQRQGVTYEVTQPLFTDGQTGIREIDVVLGRYNPTRQTGQTVVASPETIARAPRRY